MKTKTKMPMILYTRGGRAVVAKMENTPRGDLRVWLKSFEGRVTSSKVGEYFLQQQSGAVVKFKATVSRFRDGTYKVAMISTIEAVFLPPSRTAKNKTDLVCELCGSKVAGRKL